jgi:hypothetical protein
MSQEGEIIPPINVRTKANSLLDQLPFLKRNPSTSRDHMNNTSRMVVRGVFKPLAYYLVEKSGVNPDLGNSLSKVQTPEEIIAIIIAHPDVGLDPEKQQELLSEFGPGEYRDWKTIGLAMSVKRDEHPLLQLSQQIMHKLSPAMQRELTADELSSH